MAELIIKKPSGTVEHFSLTRSRTTIGRSVRCDLCISDPFAARLHAEIQLKGDDYWLMDLGSTNGTLYNRSIVTTPVHLETGGEIWIGETRMIFDEDPGGTTVIPPERYHRESERTGHLISKVGVALLSSNGLDETLIHVASLVFETIPAERVVIMLRDEKTNNEMEIKVARLRGSDAEIGQVFISRAIMTKVEKGKSVLTTDPQDFNREISSKQVGFVLAVPLSVVERNVFGIIYADAQGAERAFTDEHLDLLTTLASVASIRIESAQFLEERIKNDRIGVEQSPQFTTTFDFPEQLKIPCEQYLLYFATFLRDLGIKAVSNIEEEAGKVLFSVIPVDDAEALDKVREALALYLNLPSSPIAFDASFAGMRLEQQIENLQHSQKMAAREIRLAQKVIESQDRIIDEKNSLINQQSSVIEKIISKSLMIDSLESKDELEQIYEGLKIGESEFLKEQFGIHLNPATFLKTVGKRILGKTDSELVLGLEDETKAEDN